VSGSEAITHDVAVRVRSRYVPEQSDPDHGTWLFAYTVVISNMGDRVVQLVSRHWVITDANGQVEEVRGPGVVGAQPVLRPGESFEYTSACPLPTSFGTMHGSYQMIDQDGEPFEVDIAAFSLSMPYAVN
jgi:ApaG protein